MALLLEGNGESNEKRGKAARKSEARPDKEPINP